MASNKAKRKAKTLIRQAKQAAKARGYRRVTGGLLKDLNEDPDLQAAAQGTGLTIALFGASNLQEFEQVLDDFLAGL